MTQILWGCKFEDKGDPQNPQTLVPNEQWIPISHSMQWLS